ncbi:MAG TPA: caib/baif family protein [Anaeromyxobacteraceae bacterium]|nr:caib/baif family protein [Anaeromyxobacteraceae bacterium]
MPASRRRPGPPARPPDPPRAAAPRIVVPSERRVLARPAEIAPAPGVRAVSSSGFYDTSRGVAPKPAAPPPPPVMSRRQFEQELQRLMREFAQGEENPGSVSCTDCRQCVSCMFCRDCEECYRCTHSVGCRSSSHLTHCTGCTGCHDCAYCEQSENCTRSSYLVLSRSCSECTYCFGCVGLAKKDFHVLNVKYGRTEYFRIVAGLRKELGLPE